MSTQVRTKQVLGYLDEHPFTEIHYQSIASALGMTPNQVFGAISALRRRDKGLKINIDSPRKGFYVYRPAVREVEVEPVKPPSGPVRPVPYREVAEVIALLADGRLLVNVEGTVYVAEELVVP